LNPPRTAIKTKRNKVTELWKRIRRLLIYVILIAVAFVYFTPFVYSILGSFMTDREVRAYPPTFLPSRFIPGEWSTLLDNYAEIWRAMHFLRWIFNSVLIAVSVTLANLFFASLAGYAFARLKFPGRDKFFTLLLGTMMIPGAVTMIPGYIIYARLGWLDTYYVLIIPALAQVFNIFLMRQFYQTIPEDLFDAARMDGCSLFGIFWRIMLPLSTPALAALAIYTFMGQWNNFMGPLLYMSDMDMWTIPLGITWIARETYFERYNIVLAGSMFNALPTLIVFILFQKYFIKGIALTGLK